ncbi:hypothetical protein CDL12_29748 [Handroanthus impetiginosus]|uniref:Uncharacterized protein n=1 Tax=Handroanthus impetiginosus TaxID=429701 RepID=A0A2G9FXJ5_9LAMI|nr:hypothetical protein CDL12_29748 [Handroanthus impetiginosus]
MGQAIYPLKVSSSEAAVEVFFGPGEGIPQPGEIIGISASIFSSVMLINVKDRGIFAYRLHGQLIWSAGPVLYQHGYRQGCKKNITECYFTSVPVIDHCEASIFIFNTVGELYSLSVRGPYFKWIQDLGSFGSTFTITTGNNGRLYVTVPDKALVLALDVSTGSILWQGGIGPLSSADYEPVVDANGWITFGSLDGYLYSFSPRGALRKFPKLASLNSVIQVDPTEMEAKTSQTTAEYTHVSALKPKNVVFTVLVPSSGSIILSESDPSKFLFKLFQSDLQHFLLDERTLLAFYAVSRNGNPLPCRSTRQKLASSCSQVMPKSISIYTGNEKTIILFLLIESVLLVLLAAVVKYCCIFWKKKKLQALDLGKFLEKRRSLRSQKKEFDKMITELEQKASEEAVGNEVLEKLSDLVKERDGIKRKLSTTYSLGRDGQGSRPKSMLPLYNGKTKSYSFQGSKKESVTIFHTLSETSSCTSDEYYSSPLMENDLDKEYVADEKGKGKAVVEVESCCSDYEEEEGVRMYDADADNDDERTEDFIKLPVSSNSGHGNENDDPYESGGEAINSDSLPLKSDAVDEVNGEAPRTITDVGFEMTESVAVVEKTTSVSSVRAENGSLAIQSEFSNTKKDETLLTLSGVKRPRLSVDEQQPSVHIIYKSLPRESKQKLEDLLQQWSQWHAQSCLSSDDSNVVLESGEETYFPALRVGLDKPSAVTFWMDNQTKTQSSKDSVPLDGTSVPLYDRGYSLALTSGDGSGSLDGYVHFSVYFGVGWCL